MSKQRYPSKEARELAEYAEAQGWTYSVSGSNHLRFDHPEVIHPVFTPATPRVGGNHKEKAKLNTALRRAREAAHA